MSRTSGYAIAPFGFTGPPVPVTARVHTTPRRPIPADRLVYSPGDVPIGPPSASIGRRPDRSAVSLIRVRRQPHSDIFSGRRPDRPAVGPHPQLAVGVLAVVAEGAPAVGLLVVEVEAVRARPGGPVPMHGRVGIGGPENIVRAAAGRSQVAHHLRALPHT
eukprot:489808-Prorocentrum_minimum.AAC.3